MSETTDVAPESDQTTAPREAKEAALVRWPSLAAEREAVSLLVAQTQAIRQRLLAIVAEAKTRLGVLPEVNLDIHLATGLWFKVGDPVPVLQETKARADAPTTNKASTPA